MGCLTGEWGQGKLYEINSKRKKIKPKSWSDFYLGMFQVGSSILRWCWYVQTTNVVQRWNPGKKSVCESFFPTKRLNSTRTERNTITQKTKNKCTKKKHKQRKLENTANQDPPYWASVVFCSHDHTPEWHVGPGGWVEAPTASARFGRGALGWGGFLGWNFPAIITLPETNSSPLKIGLNAQKETNRIPTIHF